MKKTAALLLWTFLAIEIVVISIGLVVLSIEQWFIVISLTMFITWAAFYTTFNVHIHRVLTDIVLVVYVILYRLGKWGWRKASLPSKMRAMQAKIGEPKPVAKRNSDVAGTHPRLIRKPLEVLIGYNNKKPVVVDLGKQHTLIAASTGGGKTTLIVGILIQLIQKRKRPRIYLVDLKGNREDGLAKFAPLVEYVNDPNEALRLLGHLEDEVGRRNKENDVAEPIILIMDEVADMTASTTNTTLRRGAEVYLTILARKARSANVSLLLATQHARYDVLRKEITYNLLRKIMLCVDTRSQAEVALGFKPEIALPQRPGEFILKDGIRSRRGRTLLVQTGEVDDLIVALLENIDDLRLRLWRAVALGKNVGDSITGMTALFSEGNFEQNFIKYGYRHLALAGALEPPAKRGSTYKVAQEYISGVQAVRKYIDEKKWEGQPEAFV